MRTIKLVIIGDSGVGKTSLRSQFVTGRFSTGYRATIGTDFITKTLPHYQNPEEVVTLQIWDTAGQERFSSLSTAFFRGADAALLMFDVNRPDTLQALMKWWESFKMHAPVSDEEAEDFCCVVVGNKIDLAEEGQVAEERGPIGKRSAHGNINGNARTRVSEAEAEKFLEELIPRSSVSDQGEGDEYDEEEYDDDDPFVANEEPNHSRQSTGFFMRRAASGFSLHSVSSSNREPEVVDEDEGDDRDNRHSTSGLPRTRSQSISIQSSNSHALPFRQILKSHSSDVLSGTMTTTHTSQTIYHTPSSSIFDHFESASSSPFHRESSLSPTPTPGSVRDDEPVTPAHASRVRRTNSSVSTSSTPSSSAPTITPSLFLRVQASGSTSAAPTPPTPIESSSSTSSFPFNAANQPNVRNKSKTRTCELSLPPRPERRPRLFLTSAKTGDGVSPVFEYITRRVCMSWEYDEALEARRAALGIDNPSGASTVQNTLRLRLPNGSSENGLLKLRDRLKGGGNCCGS